MEASGQQSSELVLLQREVSVSREENVPCFHLGAGRAVSLGCLVQAQPALSPAGCGGCPEEGGTSSRSQEWARRGSPPPVLWGLPCLLAA